MYLPDWKKKTQLKNKDLARLFDVDQSYITYLLKGKRRPSPRLAKRIERATAGAVTRLELLYPKNAGAS